MLKPAKPKWWGGKGHILYTIVVFVTLASLDNAAIATIPSMVLPITEALNTSETAIGFLTATVILVTALSAVAWGYWGDRSNRRATSHHVPPPRRRPARASGDTPARSARKRTTGTSSGTRSQPASTVTSTRGTRKNPATALK